jgi:hypothetical protein
MDTTLSPEARVLKRARTLFSKKPVRDPSNIAEDSNGVPVPLESRSACRFCVFGAIDRVAGEPIAKVRAAKMMEDPGWEFTNGRASVRETVVAFDRAIGGAS